MNKLQASNILHADMSHYQGDAQFTSFAANGIQAATFKATEGSGYVDPNFALFTVRARAENVPFSCYHFAVPYKNSAQAEAAFFAKQVIGSAVPSNIVWLDLEANCEGMTPDQVADWALAFEASIKMLTGKVTGLYSDVGFIQQFAGFNGRLAHMPLWIASYPGSGVDLANVVISDIGGWTDWQMWQYTDSGSIPGVPAAVDLSYARSLQAIGFVPPKQTAALDPKLADYINERWISDGYAYASDDDKRLRMYAADQLRIVAGEQPHNQAVLNGWKPTL